MPKKSSFATPRPLFPRHEGQPKLHCRPYGLDKIHVSREQRELLETHALSIFTECSNCGFPLRDTLVAILITGIDWGISASREKDKNDT